MMWALLWASLAAAGPNHGIALSYGDRAADASGFGICSPGLVVVPSGPNVLALGLDAPVVRASRTLDALACSRLGHLFGTTAGEVFEWATPWQAQTPVSRGKIAPGVHRLWAGAAGAVWVTSTSATGGTSLYLLPPHGPLRRIVSAESAIVGAGVDALGRFVGLSMGRVVRWAEDGSTSEETGTGTSVSSATLDSEGRVWVSGPLGLARLEGGRLRWVVRGALGSLRYHHGLVYVDDPGRQRVIALPAPGPW